MPALPPEPQSGVPLSASWGRQLVRYLRAITPRSSPTVRVRMGAGGTTFDGAARGRPGSGSAYHAFQVIDASDGDGLKVRVHPGVVNGITPTIDGDSLLTDPAPTIPISASTSVWLRITTNSADQPTAWEIVGQSSASDTHNPGSAGTAYLRLAIVTVLSSPARLSIAPSVGGNLQFAVGQTRYWWLGV